MQGRWMRQVLLVVFAKVFAVVFAPVALTIGGERLSAHGPDETYWKLSKRIKTRCPKRWPSLCDTPLPSTPQPGIHRSCLLLNAWNSFSKGMCISCKCSSFETVGSPFRTFRKEIVPGKLKIIVDLRTQDYKISKTWRLLQNHLASNVLQIRANEKTTLDVIRLLLSPSEKRFSSAVICFNCLEMFGSIIENSTSRCSNLQQVAAKKWKKTRILNASKRSSPHLRMKSVALKIQRPDSEAMERYILLHTAAGRKNSKQKLAKRKIA